MSELKVYKPYANRDGDVLIYHKGDGDLMLDDEDEIYLKEDADKVIAHHKYKRCLAMADRWLFAFYATNKCNDKFYLRNLKLRELAEKFKEAK